MSGFVTAQSRALANMPVPQLEALTGTRVIRVDPATNNIEVYAADGTTLLATRETVPAGRSAEASFQVAAEATNNTGTLLSFLSGTLPAMKAGVYAELICYRWRHGAVAQSFIGSFTFDGAVEEIHRQEPKDANAAQRYSFSRTVERTLADGDTPAIDLSFGPTGNTAAMSEALVLYRWLRP